MPVYLVERRLGGTTMESLERLRQRTEASCRAATARGKVVRYLRSTLVPGESRCQCLFDASSLGLIREVNDAAGFPYERIILAVELEVSRSAEDSESIRYSKQRS